MKTKKFVFTYLSFVLLVGFAISSCEGPVGPEGIQGIQGEQGIAGNDGVTGADGSDGTDGTNCWDLNNDGVDDADEDVNGDGVWDASDCEGVDGTDGNANVQAFIFNDPTWDAGSNMVLNLPELTQEVMDTYLVQAYLGFALDNVPNAIYYDVPGAANAGAYYFRSWMNVGTYTIKAVESAETDVTYMNPDVASSAKILLLAPTDTTTTDGNGRTMSPQQAIYTELAEAGIDISNYLEVCAYYGINP